MLFRALLMLAAATTTVTAQSPPPTAEPKVLLLDLGDEERALPAVHSLCDLGEGAVPLLLAHVRERLPFGNDDRACLMAIFALARLGDQASAAARPLLEHAATASGMVERQLLWALGELGPQAAVADAELSADLQKLHPPPGWSHQEWMITRFRIELGVSPAREELTWYLRQDCIGYLVAAADVLARETRPLEREMQAALLDAFSRTAANLTEGRAPGMERAVHELARAVVLRVRDAPERLAALGAVVGHFDPDLRAKAVLALGDANSRDAVVPLMIALGDASVPVRRDAILALGMLGPLAVDAIPALETLTEGADQQIAARAAASLRNICGRR